MNARDDTLLAQQPVLLTGNHAVAWAARLARPKVVPVYPITPQTPILEKLTEFQAAGEFDADNVSAMPGQYLDIFWFGMVAAVVLFLLSPVVKRWMGGVK